MIDDARNREREDCQYGVPANSAREFKKILRVPVVV
jgi:hypothetical protein